MGKWGKNFKKKDLQEDILSDDLKFKILEIAKLHHDSSTGEIMVLFQFLIENSVSVPTIDTLSINLKMNRHSIINHMRQLLTRGFLRQDHLRHYYLDTLSIKNKLLKLNHNLTSHTFRSTWSTTAAAPKENSEGVASSTSSTSSTGAAAVVPHMPIEAPEALNVFDAYANELRLALYQKKYLQCSQEVLETMTSSLGEKALPLFQNLIPLIRDWASRRFKLDEDGKIKKETYLGQVESFISAFQKKIKTENEKLAQVSGDVALRILTTRSGLRESDILAMLKENKLEEINHLISKIPFKGRYALFDSIINYFLNTCKIPRGDLESYLSPITELAINYLKNVEGQNTDPGFVRSEIKNRLPIKHDSIMAAHRRNLEFLNRKKEEAS